MLRGHDADDDSGVAKSNSQIAAGGDGFRDAPAGKKFLVNAILDNRFGDNGFVSPEAHAVRAFAAEHDGDASAPRSRADYGDLAHAGLDPNRFSVPDNRRRIFAECFTTMSTDAVAIRRRATGALPYSWRSNARLGKAATAAMDPREM